MFTTGLVDRLHSSHSFSTIGAGARFVVALASLTSIGWMAIVNFMIDSDFKWLLLAFNLPWIVALILSWRESRQT